jgi:hypothetical protein
MRPEDRDYARMYDMLACCNRLATLRVMSSLEQLLASEDLQDIVIRRLGRNSLLSLQFGPQRPLRSPLVGPRSSQSSDSERLSRRLLVRRRGKNSRGEFGSSPAKWNWIREAPASKTRRTSTRSRRKGNHRGLARR